MKNLFLFADPQVICYANDNTAVIDELWARTALMTLISNLVSAQLVHRDFEDMIADHGDVVNAHRPQDLEVIRTDDESDVVIQDVRSTKIRVPLDQWLTVSFLIRDGERSKAFKDLVELYLEPAARAMAEQVDRTVLGQVARLATNTAGRLGEMTSTNATEFFLDARKVMNDNRAPRAGRNLILSTNAETELLKSSIVVEADKRGDAGSALAEASIGRIYGTQTWMDQNVPSVSPVDVDTTAGTVDSTPYAKGYGGVIVLVDGDTTSTPAVGEFVTIAGEGHAHELEALTSTADDITLVEPLKNAVAAGAAVTFYDAAAVNIPASSYPILWDTEIAVDGLTASKPLQVGQLLAIGTSAGTRNVYNILKIRVISTTEVAVTLDRPLEEAWADGAVVFPGPAGDFNLMLTRDAVALVVRPLQTAPSVEGANSFVVSFNSLSMRLTSSYNQIKKGTHVTLDLLCGVQILDDRLACILYS